VQARSEAGNSQARHRLIAQKGYLSWNNVRQREAMSKELTTKHYADYNNTRNA
jgi:hypothetical protein